jgi:hypothetical protein
VNCMTPSVVRHILRSIHNCRNQAWVLKKSL